jgi:uncharacterized protein YndB with AHSA1/START domain
LVKKLGIAALVLVVLTGMAAAFVASRPDNFHVDRSAVIHAPPAVVFALLDDHRQGPRWSPWDRRDPNIRRSFEGPSCGVGAVYAWQGNSEVGEGRLTIQESRPAEFLAMELQFFKPFAGTNRVTYTLTPVDDGTRVTWAIDGKNDFLGKAVSLVFNCEAMVGKDFEEGLANLDAAAREDAKALAGR